MAEVVHSAAPAYSGQNLGKEYAGIAAVPLGPLGQGLAGPPPRGRREHPKPEKHRAEWSAGPGGPKGYGAVVPRKYVMTGGIRNKQLEGFVGAAEQAAMQDALQEARARPQTSHPRGMDGPNQKEIAIRSAERAMRPWSAYAGNGERHGANFGYMVNNPPPGPDGKPAPPGFDYPKVKQVLAVNKAAEQVKGKGAGQRNAEGAYSCHPKQPARELFKQDFVNQLALMFDGLREGHEPYRHLATEAVHAFLRTRSPHLKAAATECLPGLRLALQTYEPSLVGHALLMLQW
ncbi:hypothetical protein DUNSADRAFT_150 [Dunaliella salina]|uniref:Uncharacterized protein n=1 Tax=Dunaliella salina TaxID=3046 RepID=A0ABQ7FZH3_DUNSA|nr:hypothetical protein DUNSADRAFT_150 [Dunaliella salina]|eukprot:KAF5827744.1 hypothetical protein DUNSADRAFT_150 [Dunaliella salina]